MPEPQLGKAAVNGAKIIQRMLASLSTGKSGYLHVYVHQQLFNREDC